MADSKSYLVTQVREVIVTASSAADARKVAKVAFSDNNSNVHETKFLVEER